MIIQLTIERSDAKHIGVMEIDPPHEGAYYELSIGTTGATVVVYLTKEERGRLIEALMEPKK